jgi:hypothetical protein
MTDEKQGAEGHSSRGKLARLLVEYDLPEVGDELVERWTRESDRSSLRDLAEYVNERLVAAALARTDARTLDGEAANYYRLLTSDDVTSGTRVEARHRLEQAGVDVERLVDDFVSRQAVHTYLRTDREASYDATSGSDRIEARKETVQRLRNRLSAVTERTLSELVDAGLLSLGSARVTVLVQVECRDCGNQYSFTDLLTRGGCDCEAGD